MKTKKIVSCLLLVSAFFVSGCQTTITSSTSSQAASTSGTATSTAVTAEAEYEDVDLTSSKTNFDSETIYSTTADVSTIAANGGSGSKWVVTGDSVITSLNNAGTIVDASGATVTIKANGTTVVSGTSSYTITCTSYSTSTSSMAALSAPTKDTTVSFPSSL
jgi:hypothetical protein